MKWIKRRPECKTIKDVVLANVGMSEADFLSPTKNYFINGLTEAATVIKKAMSKGEKITLVADYDADGVCSGTILKLVFDALGYNLNVRIPRRFSEGYGISEKIIDEIDSGLLITADNGIAAPDAIQKAKDKGLTVIVTDHHLPGEKLPPADIIIDPNAIPASAAFNGYCGAGIVYKLAIELLGKDHKIIPKLVSLAAIATVADVMPLIEENRLIVAAGLVQMVTYEGRTTGLGALLEVCEMDRVITEKNIAFKIAPIINAASRMADNGAETSYNLLSFNGKLETARDMALALYEINERRKEEKDAGLKSLEKTIVNNCLFGDCPLCVYSPGLSEGLIGIYAGSLAEKYKVPCFVFTDAEEPGVLKGSGRSYGGVHLKNLLDSVSDVLYKYGGHAEAAGVSVLKENYETMAERMHEILSENTIKSDDTVFYDLELSVDEIPKAIAELREYAPYGEGNPEIVFKIQDFMLSPGYTGYYRTMGTDDRHIKLLGVGVSALGFDMTQKYLDMGEPKVLNIVGMLSQNYFMGRYDTQIELLDMADANRKTQKTEMASLLSKMAKERY